MMLITRELGTLSLEFWRLQDAIFCVECRELPREW